MNARRLPRLRLVAAQDRAELGPLLALTLLVLVTAFLLAAVPRQIAAAESDALRAAVRRAAPAALELSASSTNTAPAGQMDAVDAQLRRDLAPVLRSRVTTPVRSAQSNAYDLLTPDGQHLRPQPFSWLMLAHQPGLLDGVRWVRGAAPSADGPDRVRTAADGTVPLLRVGMETGVAVDLDLTVGRTYVVRPLSPQPGGVGTFAVRLTGAFERKDPDDPRWDYLTQVWDKGERYTAEGALLAEVGAALVDESQVEALRRAAGTLRYDWHYPVAPSTLTPDAVPAVLAAVRSSIASASSATIPLEQESYRGPTVAMGSGLVELLGGHLASSRATSSVVGVAVAGLAVVALLVLSLAGLVVVLRRGPVLTLARARGASTTQVVGLVAAGVAAGVVPAAVLGAVIARALVGRASGGLDLWLAGGTAAWSVGSCAVAAWWQAVSHPVSHRRTPALRPALEAGLVVVAAAGTVLLRARAGEEPATARGVDPLLAAAPVLVALAVAVVLLRLAPLLVDRLAATRRGSPGLVSFLGLARAARQPAVLAAPLAALLVALCFAVLAAGAVRTVDRAQVSGTWRDVGADYRVQATFVPPETLRAIRELPGVRAVAAAYVRTDGGVLDDRRRTLPALTAAVDLPAYSRVLGTAPADAGLTDEREAVAALRDAGRDPDGPLPVLVTRGTTDLLAGSQRVDLGGGLGETDVDQRAVTDRFPLDDGRDLVVADLAAVQARESAPVRPNTVLVAGAPGLAGQLRAIAAGTGQPHLVLDRRADLAQVRASPFVGSTRDLFALVVPAAVGYALLATVLGLVLAAPGRRRDTAVLRRLGASGGETTRLALTEQGPVALAMLLGGGLAGLVLVRLALAAVDLAPLTGGAGPPDVTLPLVAATWLTGGLLVLVAVATAVVSTVERRRLPVGRDGGGQ